QVSSSRAVGRFREVVAGKRKTARDPRFEGGGGSSKLNYDIFRKAYGFLGTYQDSEIEELKKSLKKEKNQVKANNRVGAHGRNGTHGVWCPVWIRADIKC
ncbi:unnamed protein product, partial [Laminaria digitata]